MSLVDKALAAITPKENDADRIEATRRARAMAEPGDWLSHALDHHDRIREAFEAARSAIAGSGRLEAMRQLGLILNGHSLAEEVVLYPAMTRHSEKGAAMMAYEEQTMAKIEMSALERLDPSSQEWLDKLEHIRTAVMHHIYEEENQWFVDLKSSSADQDQLSARFKEEFDRYVTSDQRSVM